MKNDELLDEERERESFEDVEMDLWRVRLSGLIFLGIMAIALILIIVVFLIGMQTSKVSGMTKQVVVPDFKDVGFIISENAWVWQAPSETAPRIFNLVRGTGVFVLKATKGWYQIWVQGQTGWVKADDLITKADKKKRQKALAASLEITELKHMVDEVGNLVIVGSVVNRSDIPVSNVRIRIDVYDAEGNLSDQATTYVATDKPLIKDKPQSFTYVFTHKTGDYQIEASIESWH